MKINNFNSDVGCDNDSLDVCDDVSSRLEQVKVDILVSDVGCDSDSLDVCDDTLDLVQNRIWSKALPTLKCGNVPNTTNGMVSPN